MWQSHQVRHNFDLTQLTQSQVEILNIFEINDIQQYVCISDKNPNMKVKFFPLGLKALTNQMVSPDKHTGKKEKPHNKATQSRKSASMHFEHVLFLPQTESIEQKKAKQPHLFNFEKINQ